MHVIRLPSTSDGEGQQRGDLILAGKGHDLRRPSKLRLRKSDSQGSESLDQVRGNFSMRSPSNYPLPVIIQRKRCWVYIACAKIEPARTSSQLELKSASKTL